MYVIQKIKETSILLFIMVISNCAQSQINPIDFIFNGAADTLSNTSDFLISKDFPLNEVPSLFHKDSMKDKFKVLEDSLSGEYNYEISISDYHYNQENLLISTLTIFSYFNVDDLKIKSVSKRLGTFIFDSNSIYMIGFNEVPLFDESDGMNEIKNHFYIIEFDKRMNIKSALYVNLFVNKVYFLSKFKKGEKISFKFFINYYDTKQVLIDDIRTEYFRLSKKYKSHFKKERVYFDYHYKGIKSYFDFDLLSNVLIGLKD